MARTIIAILLITLSGCANFYRDAECDVVACQDDKWDKYDDWSKRSPLDNIEP